MNYTNEGKQVLAELGIDPVYTITMTDSLIAPTAAEQRYAFGESRENTVAFTSPTCDLMFSKNLLHYEWRGRGFCCVFCQPPEHMSRSRTLGVMIHEAAHWLDNFDRPERSEKDAGKALKQSWQNVRRESEHHNPRWLRALVHLWSRANAAGYEIPLSDTVNLGQYGFKPSDLLPLLKEAESRSGESIEAILAEKRKPVDQVDQFRTPSRAANESNRPAATRPVGRRRIIQMTPVGAAEFFPDGSVEVGPSVDGSTPARRFASAADFNALLRGPSAPASK